MGQDSVLLQTHLLILMPPEEKIPSAKGACHEEADEVGEIFFFLMFPPMHLELLVCDSKKL